uniref:Replication-associated protein n=1 Tax=Emberiza rustica CRESS-DNA-virus sp. TaxID=2815032 RepID=A0A8A4XBZ6_9VIRU|nr:MAG: replication-associated protein [Emberiza rustica CRESS-DNA-virus sp.]
MTTPGRARGWVIVINNYTEDDKERVAHVMKTAVYAAHAYEVGEECGTPHIQMYAYYANARSMSSMSKLLPRAHLIVADGSALSNRTYVFGPWTDPKGTAKSKPANPTAVESGVMPIQGKRTDIESLYATLDAGASMRTVLDTECNYQCIQISEKYLKYKEAERDFVTEVRWYHGQRGCGKLAAARAWLGDDTYVCSRKQSRFLDGYDAHQGVLINDLKSDWIAVDELAAMGGSTPYRVDTKGGTRQLLARKIAIVCHDRPDRLYVPLGDDYWEFIESLSAIVEVPRKPNEGFKRPLDYCLGQVGDPEFQIPPADVISNSGSEPPDAQNISRSFRIDGDSSPRRNSSPATGWSAESSGPSDDSVRGGKVSLPVRQEGRQGPLQVCYDPQEGRYEVRPEEAERSCDEGGFELASYTSEQSYPGWPTYDGLQEDDDAYSSESRASRLSLERSESV